MLSIAFNAVHGQSTRSVQQQINAISAYNTAHTPEKIFIQTDKQNYNKEDTIWFKAYVFDASSLSASTKTGLIYMEITDATDRVINRNMVSLTAGLGWGNIPLVDNRFPEGTYTLRAYTNWMRNFDEHYIFTRQFTIEGALDEDWMINSRFELTEKEGQNNVKTGLAFFTNEGHRMFAEALKTRITAGRRNLYRTNLTTGVDGTLDFDFNLPDKVTTKDINISLTKKIKGEKEVTFNVPVIINRDEKTDLQFMPEGGSLINGMLNNVAFKAINEEGKGVNVQGEIYNSKGQSITTFSSKRLGMGAFKFRPEPDEIYTARVNFHGKLLSFPLPQAKSSGVMLNVDNITDKDSVFITVTPSANARQLGGIYYLIGQSPAMVCYGARVNLTKGASTFSVNREAFPTGVVRFTVLSATSAPVAERIIFIDHKDRIRIDVIPSKTTYGSRDSVSLAIIASDKDGFPVQGSFSLAVTDNAQVKLDSTTLPNLPAKLLLADDLKGEIENPGWYFSKGDSALKVQALDVLLLTQGWVNYKWTDVFAAKPKPLLFKAEPEFAVKGRVLNAFNKPVEKSNIILLSLKPVIVADTMTNAAGEFSFTGISPPDTVAFNLQARNKRGRSFNVGIELDDFTPPVWSASQQRLIPPYVNIDTSRLNAMRTKALYNQEEAKITGRQLQEVQIKAKKIIKESKSLVGPGEADFTLNSDDIKSKGKMTMEDLFKKNIPGFVVRENGMYTSYIIDNKAVVLIIDGIKSSVFMGPGFGLKQMLQYMDADDAKGIEVMTTGNNQIPYTQQHLSPLAKFWEYAFIELTTYSGNGFTQKVPGTYIYRPPAFASKKEFYSPRYAVKRTEPGVDTRPTLFWVPNITTDEIGRATVSFYTADKTATYTVNIQGADMDGLVGAAQSKIKVVTSK
ncbi:hypothetical protein ACFQZS_07650 [Mucilaginibacter calamicampi]|uniref:MG2 domain-containing protein n=2 Tax=Mucilaginibacter calamicampi TaxID=1302352 RepID=A0ABW2YUA3_9SPHI